TLRTRSIRPARLVCRIGVGRTSRALREMVVRPTVAKLTTIVALLMLTVPLAVGAQPAGKVYRVGILGNKASDPAEAHLWQALRLGLRERGWIGGGELLVEFPPAAGNFPRAPG